MEIGYGSKLKALKDMGITQNEIREKFDIPNQYYLNRSEQTYDECSEYLIRWEL